MTDKLDHHHAAELLDGTLAAGITLDRTLAAAGLPSWPQGEARWHALAALEHLGQLRRLLDQLAVAAGCDPASSPYFPLRAMKPNAETRAAARQAIAASWPEHYGVEAPNLGVAHCGRKSRENAGSSGRGHPSTGDEHRPTSVDEGRALGPAASALAACAPRAVHDHCDDAEAEPAPTSPLASL